MRRIRRACPRASRPPRTPSRAGRARARPDPPTGPPRPIWILAIGVTLAACGDTGLGPPPAAGPIDLASPWTVVTPEAVDVDPDLVAAAIADAHAIPRLRSVLAVKDGRLFLERYFDGQTAAALADVRSVTKSVVATLAGLALERGAIRSLDQPIGELIPAEVASLTPAQEQITIRHLLTMSAGFEWDESGGGGDYTIWILSPDPLGTLLARPLIHAPGTQFTYNSAAVHLLGVALAEALHEPLPEFAARELFLPIGIERADWEPLPGAYVNGGSGIDLRPRDLARLGQLYLQDGISGTRRILPAGWVGMVTRPAYDWRADFGSLRRYTYGELWWISEGEPETAFCAWGYGGQYVYVVPDLSLVVVATTDWRGLSSEGGTGPLERQVLAVIVDRLHRAARGIGSGASEPAVAPFRRPASGFPVRVGGGASAP